MDTLVLLINILLAHVRRGQVVQQEALKFFPRVQVINSQWVLAVPRIAGGLFTFVLFASIIWPFVLW